MLLDLGNTLGMAVCWRETALRHAIISVDLYIDAGIFYAKLPT